MGHPPKKKQIPRLRQAGSSRSLVGMTTSRGFQQTPTVEGIQSEARPWCEDACAGLGGYGSLQQNADERGAARVTPLPAEVLKVSIEAPEPYAVHYAASLIQRGRVVGIPTDTFYGLSADPYNLASIERVFA